MNYFGWTNNSFFKHQDRDIQKIYSEEISYTPPHFWITTDQAVK